MLGTNEVKKDDSMDFFGLDFGSSAEPKQEVQEPASAAFDMGMDSAVETQKEDPKVEEALMTEEPKVEETQKEELKVVDTQKEDPKEQTNPVNASDLQMSLDLDLIPSVVKPHTEPLSETTEDGVPAVISQNREELCAMWKKNMTEWREKTQRYQELCSQCDETNKANDALRASVAEAQKKLDAMQEEVQKKLTRIAVMQAQLSNHLVNNGLLRPVRAVVAQPDMDNLFTAPQPVEEPKPEENDPFEDIFKIFQNRD